MGRYGRTSALHLQRKAHRGAAARLFSSEDYTAANIDNIAENRHDGKPFFAYLAFQAPHDPFQLPVDWRDRYKGLTSEGGIRTPLIVAGKGVASGRRISDAMTHVTDIPATILAAAGVTSPATFEGKALIPVQGKPLAPILTGELTTVRGDGDWLGWKLFSNRAVRQRDWKLLRLCRPAGTGGWQPYNLKEIIPISFIP